MNALANLRFLSVATYRSIDKADQAPVLLQIFLQSRSGHFFPHCKSFRCNWASGLRAITSTLSCNSPARIIAAIGHHQVGSCVVLPEAQFEASSTHVWQTGFSLHRTPATDELWATFRLWSRQGRIAGAH